MLSLCLHPPLISVFLCSAHEGGGFSPSFAFPNEALCVCVCVACVFLCAVRMCVYITECAGLVMGASLYYHGYSWMSMYTEFYYVLFVPLENP